MREVDEYIKTLFRNFSSSLLTGGGWGVGLVLLVSCARMGAPDGGWFDERAPYVVAARPAENDTNVTAKKVSIYFNEFVKVDNPSENITISPPQKEQPEIRAHAKTISITLKDSLQPNTTYTIDFSDAISDNNENNPMGSYTYTFSTGSTIDTLQVSGTVLEAGTLEPVKGILVGLMDPDSLGVSTLLRVARSDSRGQFHIKGVAEGEYLIGALKDIDGDYKFSQKAEMMSFSHEKVSPSVFMDSRQDTIWADKDHIKDIKPVSFVHYLPDNIILTAFTHEITDRYFLKAERLKPESFSLFYTAPLLIDSLTEEAKALPLDTVSVEHRTYVLPQVKLLDAPATATVKTEQLRDWAIVEPSQRGDTITYWLRDTAFVNTDTLRLELTTLVSDSLGLTMQTDTVEVLSKIPFAKRMKEKQKAEEEWQKKLAKRRKKLKEGEELTDTLMPVKHMKLQFAMDQNLAPDGIIRLNFETPMKRIERDSVHLYVEQDSLWYRAPFVFEPEDGDTLSRHWQIYSEWIPGAQYSLEIDSLAFEDIYGMQSTKYKSGLRISKEEDFASLFIDVTYAPQDSTCWGPLSQIIVYLMDGSEKVSRTAVVRNKKGEATASGTAEFYYVKPSTYYIKALVDRNGNGRWDTGDYYLDRQPEEMYYYTDPIECKAKWDITKGWNLTAKPLTRQKPESMIKQKADQQRTIQNRNAQRAAEKGVEVPLKWRRVE